MEHRLGQRGGCNKEKKIRLFFFYLCLNVYNQALVCAHILECVYFIESSDILYCTSKTGTDIFCTNTDQDMDLSDPSAQVQLGIMV